MSTDFYSRVLTGQITYDGWRPQGLTIEEEVAYWDNVFRWFEVLHGRLHPSNIRQRATRELGPFWCGKMYLSQSTMLNLAHEAVSFFDSRTWKYSHDFYIKMGYYGKDLSHVSTNVCIARLPEFLLQWYKCKLLKKEDEYGRIWHQLKWLPGNSGAFPEDIYQHDFLESEWAQGLLTLRGKVLPDVGKWRRRLGWIQSGKGDWDRV